jgi:hypothetical protein
VRGRRSGGLSFGGRDPDSRQRCGRRFRRRDYFLRGQGVKTAYDAARLARDTLRATERNKALLVKPRVAYAQWLFARLAPTLMNRVSMRFIEGQRAKQATARSEIR